MGLFINNENEVQSLAIDFDETTEFSDIITKRQKGKSILKKLDDYTVIDLETTGLDPYFNRIIELGAVKVKGGLVVDTFESLVAYPYKLDSFITELTGITDAMLENAPDIKEILKPYLDFIGEDVVVGHNVNFDVNFIYDNCNKAYNNNFSNDFLDTMRLSRRLHPELKHHRLEDMKAFYEIVTNGAHRALEDCYTTYALYNKLLEDADNRNIEVDSLAKYSHKPKIKAADIVANSAFVNEDSPFFEKTFVFTGTLDRMVRKAAMQIVVNNGGLCGDNVTKKTNYLVLGNNDYCTSIKDGKSNKQKKAEEIKLSGGDIEIISENVFYDMIQQSQESLSNNNDNDCVSEDIPLDDIDDKRIRDSIANQIDDEEYSQHLTVKTNSDGSISIKAKNTIVTKLHFRKTSSDFMEIRVGNIKFFPNSVVRDFNDEWSRIEFGNLQEVLNLAPNLAMVYMNILRTFEHESFGCCSRYMECSDAMQCIHPNKIKSEACQYKENLKHGRIFYGKNRNV